MRAARAWLSRLAASLSRGRRDRELQTELDSHFQLHIDDCMGAGMSEADARRHAALKFGSIEAIKEDYRDRRGLPALDSVLQDLRYGIRTLMRTPSFSIVALLVLALGIGVTTAIFSLVYAVYFRPLPVKAPGELVYIYTYSTARRTPPQNVLSRIYPRLVADSRPFSGIAGHSRGSYRVGVDGADELTNTELVTGNYFDLLGIRALHGRVLTMKDDDYANADNAAVISHRLWMRRFKGEAVIGRQILIGEKPFSVVGILPAGFSGLSDPWKPTDLYATRAQLSGPARGGGDYPTYPIARLRPGVTVEQAQAMIATHDVELERYFVADAKMKHLVLPASSVRMPFEPMGKIVSVRMAGALIALMGVVLAIASANVAGVLMARGVGRRGEIGVRMAIGAGGSRMVRQLLTESVLLALAGGLAGWLVGWSLLKLFVAYTPQQFQIDVPMDLRVLFFTAAVCLFAGLIVGIGPALQASRVDVLSAIGGGTMAITRRTRLRFRYGIVVPQVALSLVLLLVAGVYLKDLLRIERRDIGFSKRGAIVVQFWLRGLPPGMPPTTDERLIAERQAERLRNVYRNLSQRFETMPEVSTASLSAGLPTNYGSWRAWSVVTQDGGSATRATDRTFVSPGYFDVMGIRVLSGRVFDQRDAYTSPKVAVVSAALAKALWPDGNAVGRRIALAGVGTAPKPDEWRDIVGVVSDVAPVLQDLGDNPYIYLPLAQEWRPGGHTVIARANGDPTAAIAAIIAAVQGADLHASVTRVRAMEQVVAEILYPRRLAASLLTACSALGVLLACIGLYGVVAYSIAQRQREIGIRAALGAERGDIVRLVIGEGMKVLAAGSVIGFVLAGIALPAVSNLVIAVPGPGGALIAGVPILLGLIVLLACSLPARRASRVNPVDVLRAL